MKKLIPLVLGVLLMSCSKEDSEKDIQQNTPSKLSSITTNYYYNDYLPNYSSKLNFQDDKAIDCRYSNGKHTDYQYEGDLVSRIRDFDRAGNIIRTFFYKYDTEGKIITIKLEVIATNNIDIATCTFNFEYNNNEITATISEVGWNNDVFKFYLNQDNQIIKEECILINGNAANNFLRANYTYANKNLSTFFDDTIANSPIKGTYVYNTIKNDFNYNKYLFGKHWKNNSCLNAFTSYRWEVRYNLHITSENLISESTFTQNNTTTIKTYNYIFNSNNQISKEYIVTTNQAYSNSKELIYEYK